MKINTMLNKDIILENFKKYTNALDGLGIDSDALYDQLGVDFISAPSKTTNTMYGAFEGGLIDNAMRVTNYSIKLNNALPEQVRLPKRSLILVSMIHSIGLSQMFTPNTSKWHVDKLGKVYEFKDDLISMSAGERSIKLFIDSGNKLTDEEYQAILNYNKIDDKQSKFFTCNLGIILQSAIAMAQIEENVLLEQSKQITDNE